MADHIGASAALRDRAGPPLWRRALPRLAVYAGIWWLLTGGEPQSWLIGVPVVALAVAGSLALRDEAPQRWSLSGLLRFVPYFLWESVRGGIAAAAIVFFRVRQIEPALIVYRTRLPAGAPRALLAGVTGLLPGTLTAELRDDVLQVHVLDRSIPATAEIAGLERRIAAMVGLPAGAADGAP